MKANGETFPQPAPSNVVMLAQAEKPKRLPWPPPAGPRKNRFKITEFENMGGSKSWRVSGSKPNGDRIRENFSDVREAEARKLALEGDALAAPGAVRQLQSTPLDADQLRIAEAAFARLDKPDDLLVAVTHWKRHGAPHAAVEAPRLDDAMKQFNAWLDATPTLRDRTKANLRVRVKLFVNGMVNLPVNEISSDVIESHIDGRKTSARSKINDLRAVSRFFSWCVQRPRRWCPINPCAGVRVEQTEPSTPEILTVKECGKLLTVAQKRKAGKLAPYIAVTLFAGLRPTEAARLTWEKVNLKDGEIRLDGVSTKTGRPRVVTIGPTLKNWLVKYKDKPFYPPGWRKDFDAIKLAIGYGTSTDEKPALKRWTPDILRHTAISHYFRECGSYGETAEQFGNSESIIKTHYQGRVSTEETKKFYALKPTGKVRPRKSRK